MTIVICLDDNNGMLFNNRRQSRDSAVIGDLVEYSNGRKIFINEFSKALFSEFQDKVIVSDTFLDDANENDICFVENVDLISFKDKISALVIYKWNRVYPQDFKFNLDLNKFTLTKATEIIGTSHEKITREIYVK